MMSNGKCRKEGNNWNSNPIFLKKQALSFGTLFYSELSNILVVLDPVADPEGGGVRGYSFRQKSLL